MSTTITESLAEIATIDKRLPKKAADMVEYVARFEMLKDPLAKSGGSEKYLAEQLQSFDDLLQRKITLRAAIARANAETSITINGEEKTVADWLVWKRECYQHRLGMLRKLLAQAQSARQTATQKGVAIVKAGGEPGPEDVVVNIDEQGLLHDIDEMEEQYGRLDGLLSLKNATTIIEV